MESDSLPESVTIPKRVYDDLIEKAMNPLHIMVPEKITEKVVTLLETQVGGDHYKTMSIQPIEYILANDLGFIEGNIIKYTTRWKQKGGKQDIEKVIHYAQLLLDSLE